MKCPKCGYNSFEFHDICKKCSGDLSGHKATYGLKPIVVPEQARAAMAAPPDDPELMVEMSASQPLERDNETFSFDLPEEHDEPEAGAAPLQDDPFSFIAESEEPNELDGTVQDQGQPDENEFASLFETTSLEDISQLAQGPAAQEPVVAEDDLAEFELSGFSWDETEVTGGETGKPADTDDALEKLFGNLEQREK